MEQNVVLEMRDISKNFTGVRALSHVDFTLRKGEIHALMGENGAGKSTLIKVLTGVHEFESGTIHMAGNSNAIINHSPQEAQANGISTVYQEVNLCPNLTVAENLFIGREPRKMGMIDWKQMNERSGKLLESLDIHVPPTQMLEECSIAIQQMIAIARAVDMDCKVLILDEPTSSLDDREVEKLFTMMRRLKEKGVGIIFVTHFLEQVYAVCDGITVLRNGQLVGEYEIADLPRVKLVAAMMGKDFDDLASIKPETTGDKRKEPMVIEARGLSHAGTIKPFDLDIHKGEVIGLTGLLGSGRSELARTIYGADRAQTGTLKVKGKEVKVKNDNGSFELLSETPTETSTDKSGKKVTTTQKTQYTLKGYEDAPLASGMPDAVANDAAAVTTTNIVDINGKSIEEYGLDKPRATVTVTFANKNKRTITVGGEAPDSAGTYIMVDGDKAIYLVANDSVDSFLYKPMTFLDTSVTTAAEKSSNGTPETATISGTNFKDTLEFKANDDTTVNTAHYKMTAPVNCFVNVTNGSTVLESLRSITADEVIAYKPNDDTMSKYGLSTSNPYAKIAAKFGDGTITLYSSKPKTEKTEAATEAVTEALEDGSSSTTETTTEYAYIYNPSTNIIYKIVTTKVPWVNTSFEDMVFEYVIKADEASIKTIEVTADGKTSKFDLSTETKKDKDGNKTKSTTVKSGKNTIETSKFDIFFQNLESATVANVKTSNVSTSADLTVKITYNTDKEPDTYTFYKGETGKYNFSIDGKIILGNVFDTYVNKIIEDAPKLAKGESITAI